MDKSSPRLAKIARRCCWLVFLLGLVGLASYQRAQRYRIVDQKLAKDSQQKDDQEAELAPLRWREPAVRGDVPIVFIADDKEEWEQLKSYWTWNETNVFSAAVLPMTLDPLSAVTTLACLAPHGAVKIKVPRGLPDPTPFFPPSNPPSLGKWQIGRYLFHEKLLKIGSDYVSCTTCHDPEHGYTDEAPSQSSSDFNTLSLLNVAYNRSQFWDGRVRTLEETLGNVYAPSAKIRPIHQHNWSGVVRGLGLDKQAVADFQRVFGVPHPTQDTVGQALATYMRTLLSGDSLYDRAGLSRRKAGSPLPANHFVEHLKGDMLTTMQAGEKDRTAEQVSAMLVKGYALFHGKARCAQCHKGSLFTDDDYHNIGLTSDDLESGRSLRVPAGLKEPRLVGAFRTPTLRNLFKTRPYFHDGSKGTLYAVIGYYDTEIPEPDPDHASRRATQLMDGNEPMRLKLTNDERESLRLFLQSLEGTGVDRAVVGRRSD